MMTIIDELIKILKDAGVNGKIELTAPPNPTMGDLSFSCFDLAKEKKISPVEAAMKITTEILRGVYTERSECAQDDKLVQSVKAMGPYVNFYLNTSVLAKQIIGEVLKNKDKYGFNKTGKNKTILIEYPSNNTHKELHIGHLRNICIGNSLVKIFEANGYKVIPVNYINDFGAHVAKCLWGFLKFHQNEKPPADKQKWLGQIYSEASNYLKDHPEEEKDAQDLQKKIEAKDKSIWPLFEKTRKWSLDGFIKSFAELGVKHNAVFYEQNVKSIGQKMVDELLRKKIAQIGEGGAIIIDLQKYNLDIGLLRKSNGAGLYLTGDLGLAVAKNKKYPKIDESVCVTGSEQNFYFKQLFQILRLAGYHYKTTHIGYGLVTLPSGKMSSRAGNVILYEDARDAVSDKVLNETKTKHPAWGAKKTKEIAAKISFGAIKFDFLKHEAAKNIIFDADSAVSFDGFTGPYVLYVIARISSIIKKSKIKNQKLKINSELLKEPEEKMLLLQMAKFEEAVVKALQNYNPSVITKYSFDLAKLYNEFYNKHSVLGAENVDLGEARARLSLAVKQTLNNALNLLSISSVEEM